MLGALLGCGWTVEQVLDLSFDQMSEVARCVYAHKMQMIETVFEPIATGLGAKKGKSRKGVGTQQALKRSGMTPEQRDQALLNKLGALGFNTK